MNINLTKLKNVVGKVSGVVKANHAVPEATGVRLTTDGKDLVAVGTNLDISVYATVPCPSDKMDILVDCAHLSKILGSLKGEMVSMRETKSHVELKAGGSSFRLGKMAVESFPQPPASGGVGGEKKVVSPVEFRSLILGALPAASADPVRFILNGVFIDGDNRCMVGTDGRRLHRVSFPAGMEVDGKCTIPAVLAKTMAGHLAKADAATFQVDERRVRLTINNPDDEVIIVGKVVEGTFPNWKQVIPKERSPYQAQLQSEDAVQTIRRASLISDDASQNVSILAKDGFFFAYANSNAGDCEDTCMAVGELPKLVVNPDYMGAALAAARDFDAEGKVEIQAKDGVSPVVVEAGRFLAVVMPIRTN